MAPVVRSLAVLLLLGGCSKVQLDYEGRACELETCLPGWVCNPLSNQCVRAISVACDGTGICPSDVRTGSPCQSAGTFIPCDEGFTNCEAGCRTCQSDGTWSACTGGCVEGTVANCRMCGDDCTGQIDNARAICLGLGVGCDYTACNAGFVDADADRTNGCECAVDCAGKCGGTDGCGGTCPDDCTGFDTCGGGGTLDVCGCLPTCFGVCGGQNGCGGTCPDTCIPPDVCGNGGPNLCGCIPVCSGRCSGPDGCMGQCPDDCTGFDTCGGGTVPDGCGCTTNCTGRCTGPDGCGGTCPDDCMGFDTCGGGMVADACGCTADCTGKCAGPDGCGGTCTAGCPPGETCGGAGTADECGCCTGWWNCDYANETQIQITTGFAIPAGYALTISFDHAGEVPANSLANGDDIRVVYDNGSTLQEIDRVLDPESAWNRSTTTIWFATQAAITPGINTDYLIYNGNPAATAPMDDIDNVFTFADLFDRGNSASLGNGWTEVEGGGQGQVDLNSGALRFAATADGLYNRPIAQHTFSPLTQGLVFRTRVHWERPNNTDLSHRMFMQLGDGFTTPANMPALPSTGVGPTPMTIGVEDPGYVESFGGYDSSSVYYYLPLQSPADRTFRAVVDIMAQTYNVQVDGGPTTAWVQLNAMPAAFRTALTSIDEIRFLTWDAAAGSGTRRLDYVIVRPHIDPEPTMSLPSTRPKPCP